MLSSLTEYLKTNTGSNKNPYKGLSRAKRKFSKQRAKFYGDIADALDDGANPYHLFSRRYERGAPRKLPFTPLYALWRDRAALAGLKEAWEGTIPSEDLLVVSAGERGNLPDSLRFLAKVVNLRKANAKNIRVAVAMPAFMMIVMVVFQMVIAVKMMPIMTEIMPPENFPLAGGLLYDLSQFILSYWYLIYGLPAILLVAFFVTLRSWTGSVRAWMDRNVLPYMIFRDIRAGEFLMSLAALTQANVSLYDALTMMLPHCDKWTRLHLQKMRFTLQGDHDVTRAVDTGLLNPEIYDRVCEYAERTNFESGLRKIGLTTIEEVAESIQMRSVVVRNILMALVGGFVIFSLLGILSVGMAAGDAATQMM